MKKTILAMAGAVALFGCGGGGGHHGGSSSSTAARVAYINASPDTATVDFRLNGGVTASAVAYGAATAFSNVDAQDADFSIRPSGATADSWSEADTLTADTDNLVVAVGLNTPPSDTSVTPPVVEELKRLQLYFDGIDRTAPTSGLARIIVVNALVRQAGDDTPAIDFKTTDTPTTVNVANVAFGGFSSQDVAAGTVNYEVQRNGIDQTFVASTPLTLASGAVYVALVTGLEGSTGNPPTIKLIPLTTRAATNSVAKRR